MADQLGELVRRGEFAPGGRLPPERDLARRLGVSRPVVREAMVALEIAGLVEVRTGSGIYARAGTGDGAAARQPPFVLPDAGPSPFDLIAARRLLEPEIAFAAAGATAGDIAGIAETLGWMREAVAADRTIGPADRLFHTRVAAATGNTVLVAVVDQLWEATFAPIFRGLSRRVGLPENQRAAVNDHARILAALERRDAAGAREAMRAHLAQVEAVMLADDHSAEIGRAT